MTIPKLLEQKCALTGDSFSKVIDHYPHQPFIIALVPKVAEPVLSSIRDWDFYGAHDLLRYLNENHKVTLPSADESSNENTISRIDFILFKKNMQAQGGEEVVDPIQSINVNSYDQFEKETTDIALIAKAFNSLDPVERLTAQLDLLNSPTPSKAIDTQSLIQEVVSYFQRECILSIQCESMPEVDDRFKTRLKEIYTRYKYPKIGLALAFAEGIENEMSYVFLSQIESQIQDQPLLWIMKAYEYLHSDERDSETKNLEEDKAYTYYKKAYELDTSNLLTGSMLARYLVEGNKKSTDYQKSFEVLQGLYEKHKDSVSVDLLPILVKYGQFLAFGDKKLNRAADPKLAMSLFERAEDLVEEYEAYSEIFLRIIPEYARLLIEGGGGVQPDRMRAYGLLQKLLKSQPENPSALLLQGKLLWEGGNGIVKDELEAVACLERALKTSPQSIQIMTQLSSIYAEGGEKVPSNPIKAYGLLHDAALLDLENPEILYKLGVHILHFSDQLDIPRESAHPFFWKAYELDPSNTQIIETLRKYYTQNSVEVVLSNIQQLISITHPQ